MKDVFINIDEIYIPTARRGPIDAEKVQNIAESIAARARRTRNAITAPSFRSEEGEWSADTAKSPERQPQPFDSVGDSSPSPPGYTQPQRYVQVP